MPRQTVVTFRDMKRQGAKIAVLTAYDYPSASVMDEAGVDAILVGDSLGNTIMGLPDTLGVTVDDMVHHTAMVSRAVKRALVIADMPFLSYQISPAEAVRNAGRLIVEGGAQCVKMEGPMDRIGGAVKAVLDAGIPVMGHLGLLPQSVHQVGGYGVQATDAGADDLLFQHAKELERAGCFSIVLEKVPAAIASRVSRALSIPTIGIGAGAGCDGQVLVMHDILGLGIKAKHSKVYVDIKAAFGQAFGAYVSEVRSGAFPAEEHSY